MGLNSKKLFEPGSSSAVQNGLRSLLRFDVSDESLDNLQHAFKLERWEQLMTHVKDNALPLPLGLEYSACGTGVSWNMRAFSTENRPSWRVTESEDSGISAGARNVFVAFQLVRELQAKLHDFDVGTQMDVTTLSGRIADCERDLAALLTETESLRAEVEQAASERDERQQMKETLMETLQVAVKSSMSGDAKKPAADAVVRNCLQKMKQAENEYFERNLHWNAKCHELAPVQAQIEELRDSKQRAMDQLSAFLEAQETERSAIIADSLHNALLANQSSDDGVNAT